MSISMRTTAAAIVAALALAACGGGGATGGAAGSFSGNTLPNSSIPSSLVVQWNSQLVAKASYVGAPTADGPMTIQAALVPQNAQGLEAYAAQASEPSSGLYRHFLTPQEIGQQFGASTKDLTAVSQYFNGLGISVNTWPQHLMVVLHGKRSAMEKAFGTSFSVYRMGMQQFLAPSAGATPHLQQAVPLGSVLLASNVTLNHTYIIRLGSGEFAGYTPQQLAHGFDYTGAWGSKLTGSGVTVGIIGTGPIDVSATGDVTHYQSAFNEISQFGLGTKGSSLSIVPALPQPASAVNNNTGTGAYDGAPSGLATPPPVTAPCGTSMSSVFPSATCNPEDGEAQLDTESIAGLAPASTIDFYLAYNNQDCAAYPGFCPAGALGIQGLYLSDDEIQQAIADNKADVLSLSYGLGEADGVGSYYNLSGVGIGPLEFAALAAEGIAVFVSSGDNGNDSACTNPSTGAPLNIPCVSYPASDPSVVGVGGVNIPLDPLGNLTGQVAAWADQTTAGGNGTFGNNVGSGGGVSSVFTTPVFQQGVLTATGANPASSSLNGMRGVPDIALDADPATGPSITTNSSFGGGFGANGGTSAAAPEAAAMWALVLQACKANSACATGTGTHPYRLGNPNGIFYKIAKTGMNGMTYGKVFYDVLYGENQGYGAPTATPTPPGVATPGPIITGCCTAGPGYDLVTGLGAPFAGHLIEAATGTAVP